MKLLQEITEHSLGIGEVEQLGEKYELRKSARVILLDEDGNIAVQHLQNYHYHKLPGGGVDPGETLEQAAKREVLEEVGCECEILEPIGLVIEYRNKYNLLHIAHCYVGKVVGEKGVPSLEPEEIEEGQVTLWIPAQEMLEKVKMDVPGKYEGHFILARERAFLEEYLSSH